MLMLMMIHRTDEQMMDGSFAVFGVPSKAATHHHVEVGPVSRVSQLGTRKNYYWRGDGQAPLARYYFYSFFMVVSIFDFKIRNSKFEIVSKMKLLFKSVSMFTTSIFFSFDTAKFLTIIH